MREKYSKRPEAKSAIHRLCTFQTFRRPDEVGHGEGGQKIRVGLDVFYEWPLSKVMLKFVAFGLATLIGVWIHTSELALLLCSVLNLILHSWTTNIIENKKLLFIWLTKINMSFLFYLLLY